MRKVLVGASVLVVCVALVAALVQLTRQRVWVAQVPVTLVTSSESGAATIDPYARSVTARRNIVATYAAVVNRASSALAREHPDVDVAVLGSGSDAVLTISARGSDRDEVRATAEAAAARGDELVRDAKALSALAVTDVGNVRLTPAWSWSLF